MNAILISAMWCPSCLIMNGIYQRVFQSYPMIPLTHIDFDEESDKVISFQIGNILPVLILFEKGTEKIRIIGEKSKKEVERFIEAAMHENA